MFDLQTEAIEAADQLERRGGASTNDANGSVEFPAGGIFLKGLEDSNPDSGDTASDSNALADHQAKNTFRIDTRTGEDQARAEHGAGIGQAPGVGMEHGSDRQDGVKAAHAKDFAEATRKRVQHQRAVRINDAFGMPGGAGGEAHGGAVVFVDLRIAEIIAGFGKQLFVIQEAIRHGVATVGHDDHALEGNILAKFFVQRRKSIRVTRRVTLGRGGNWAHATTKSAQRGKVWRSSNLIWWPILGKFLLQKRLISETMQQTAEATVSRLR